MKRPKISFFGLAIIFLVGLLSFGAVAMILDVARIHTTVTIQPSPSPSPSPSPTPQPQADIRVYTNSSRLERLDLDSYHWIETIYTGQGFSRDIYVYNAGDIPLYLNLTASGLESTGISVYWSLEGAQVDPGQGLDGNIGYQSNGAAAGTYDFDIEINGSGA